jgi:hypothetical protein
MGSTVVRWALEGFVVAAGDGAGGMRIIASFLSSLAAGPFMPAALTSHSGSESSRETIRLHHSRNAREAQESDLNRAVHKYMPMPMTAAS